MNLSTLEKVVTRYGLGYVEVVSPMVRRYYIDDCTYFVELRRFSFDSVVIECLCGVVFQVPFGGLEHEGYRGAISMASAHLYLHCTPEGYY